MKKSEMACLQNEEQQNMETLKEMITAKHQELEYLNAQQIEDLLQFENDVQSISRKFSMDPPTNETNTLVVTVSKLHQDLEAKVSELSDYRQAFLQIKKEKIAQKDTTQIDLKIFEEDINDICSLNEKLTKFVGEMTEKVNSYRNEINKLIPASK